MLPLLLMRNQINMRVDLVIFGEYTGNPPEGKFYLEQLAS